MSFTQLINKYFTLKHKTKYLNEIKTKLDNKEVPDSSDILLCADLQHDKDRYDTKPILLELFESYQVIDNNTRTLILNYYYVLYCCKRTITHTALRYYFRYSTETQLSSLLDIIFKYDNKYFDGDDLIMIIKNENIFELDKKYLDKFPDLFNFESLDNDIITNQLNLIDNKPWINELKKNIKDQY